MLNIQSRFEVESKLAELIQVAPEMVTPYRDLPHRLLRARMLILEVIFDDRLEWTIKSLELKFADAFGYLPPTELAQLYALCLGQETAKPRPTLVEFLKARA
jgi:hypothetical protein